MTCGGGRDASGNLGVGGEGRATVRPDDVEMGDDRGGSLPGEVICNNEK